MKWALYILTVLGMQSVFYEADIDIFGFDCGETRLNCKLHKELKLKRAGCFCLKAKTFMCLCLIWKIQEHLRLGVMVAIQAGISLVQISPTVLKNGLKSWCRRSTNWDMLQLFNKQYNLAVKEQQHKTEPWAACIVVSPDVSEMLHKHRSKKTCVMTFLNKFDICCSMLKSLIHSRTTCQGYFFLNLI